MPIQSDEIHSDEVEEILGHIPNWITQYGVVLLFILLVSVLVFSHFLKVPTTIKAPILLTTINPPSPIISKSSGRIQKWNVRDGDVVKRGSIVAVMESPGNFQDILYLRDKLEEVYNNFNSGQILQFDYKMDVDLGSIQRHYNSFIKEVKEFRSSINNSIFFEQAKLLRQKIVNRENQLHLLRKQYLLKQKEFSYSHRLFKRDSSAYKKGIYGISQLDYEQSIQKYLSQQAHLLNSEYEIKSAEISTLDLKQDLFRLEAENQKSLTSQDARMLLEVGRLLSEIENWFDQHVLLSSIDGKITLTNFWNEHQYVRTGDLVATTVPLEESSIIARGIVNSSQLSRIEEGFRVRIELSGFSSTEYGYLEGVVSERSLVPDEEGYSIGITLDEGMNSIKGNRIKFLHEMNGIAMVIVENNNILSRLVPF